MSEPERDIDSEDPVERGGVAARRLAALCGLVSGSRLLAVCEGPGPLAGLLSALDSAALAHPEPASAQVAELVEAARAAGLSPAVRALRLGASGQGGGPSDAFAAVLLDGGALPLGAWADLAKKARALLEPRGAFAGTLLVRVGGRSTPPESDRPWPQEVALALSRCGFEPITLEMEADGPPVVLAVGRRVEPGDEPPLSRGVS